MSGCPKKIQIITIKGMLNRPETRTAGNMSLDFPRRSMIVNTAKPSAANKAAKSPWREVCLVSPSTITSTPHREIAIATQVCKRTLSFIKMRARIAVKKGAVENRSRVLATEVFCNE